MALLRNPPAVPANNLPPPPSLLRSSRTASAAPLFATTGSLLATVPAPLSESRLQRVEEQLHGARTPTLYSNHLTSFFNHVSALTSEVAQLKTQRLSDSKLLEEMQEFNRHLLRRLEERGVDMSSERRLDIISDSMNTRLQVYRRNLSSLLFATMMHNISCGFSFVFFFRMCFIYICHLQAMERSQLSGRDSRTVDGNLSLVP